MRGFTFFESYYETAIELYNRHGMQVFGEYLIMIFEYMFHDQLPPREYFLYPYFTQLKVNLDISRRRSQNAQKRRLLKAIAAGSSRANDCLAEEEEHPAAEWNELTKALFTAGSKRPGLEAPAVAPEPGNEPEGEPPAWMRNALKNMNTGGRAAEPSGSGSADPSGSGSADPSGNRAAEPDASGHAAGKPAAERTKADLPERPAETPEDPLAGPPDLTPGSIPEPAQDLSQPQEQKIRFRPTVTLLRSEYMQLIRDHGKEDAEKLLDILHNYKASSRREYGSDYAAIEHWCVNRLAEDKRREAAKKRTESPFKRGRPRSNRELAAQLEAAGAFPKPWYENSCASGGYDPCGAAAEVPSFETKWGQFERENIERMLKDHRLDPVESPKDE